ncbi:hypothetical protein F4824DRAFT_359144 [Ustulina deusta]|nr:hypothetical protein F4823DRAFT_230841 [Ustulina deusta]KAI3340947.1 hypothetical protein F4824DRAFT_359144 [Ustulina deusta]
MGLVDMTASSMLFASLHFFQFVLALAVIGLYGTDLDRADREEAYSDGKWVYAIVVASLSAATAILFLIPSVRRFPVAPVWSTILFGLWIALFGLFAKMYLHEDPEGNGDTQRMKNALWVDLANSILWVIGALAGAIYWVSYRRRNSRFTGRAKL